MVHRIHDLIERFPEDENTVRSLIAGDVGFDALCSEYQDIVEELSEIQRVSGPVAAIEGMGLKMRRTALEEELLTRIEGYRPI